MTGQTGMSRRTLSNPLGHYPALTWINSPELI